LKDVFDPSKATFLFILSLSNGHLETSNWILSNFNENNNVTKYINLTHFNKIFSSAYKYDFKTLELLLDHYKVLNNESIINRILDYIPIKGFDIAYCYLKFIDSYYKFDSVKFIIDRYSTKIHLFSNLKKEFITKFIILKSRTNKLAKI
jgi:hypothetical protein